MNELQIWFAGSDEHDNWIYFKTNTTDIDDAINHFKETIRYSGIDLCDMKPVQYDLWNGKDRNHIGNRVVIRR